MGAVPVASDVADPPPFRPQASRLGPNVARQACAGAERPGGAAGQRFNGKCELETTMKRALLITTRFPGVFARNGGAEQETFADYWPLALVF